MANRESFVWGMGGFEGPLCVSVVSQGVQLTLQREDITRSSAKGLAVRCAPADSREGKGAVCFSRGGIYFIFPVIVIFFFF